ncbi:MAG: germination protein YpeB [Clostridiales bacterium]|nr:germination protein YpeB [Clostridiales bacterium]
MEKKIGKNVSSGAEKVESVEKKVSPEEVNAQPQKKSKAKKSAAPKAKKSEAKKSKKHSTRAEKAAKAEKAESAAAERRIEKAKLKAARKEKKLLKKAELKQKKLEKKAALEEKKLAKKAALAEKKAERKARALKRKAELKEKRSERHAERVARRELLKNESREEKRNRIAREKKEKLALKRRKQEAAEKQREQKLKAREAAHQRKAEDRKHKRETRNQQRKNKQRTPGIGGWLAAVISLGVACLALATVVTAGSFQMSDMTLTAENGYRATLYEMVSASEDMDSNLNKLRVATGANEQRKLLTEILVDSALMENALERLPVDGATSTDISSFVNKTGSYARTLLGKLAKGQSLTEKEMNTLSYLYDVNTRVYNELNDLATHMTASELRAFVGGEEGEMRNKFGEIGRGTHEEPKEAVDAPFSGAGNVGENKLSKMDEITEAKAEELAKNYFNSYHVVKTQYTGETTAQGASFYNFVMTDENEIEIFAQISKNGGKLAFFDTYETCTQKNFDLETCDSLAREFLADLGIKNVEAVWLSDAGMVADLTYVSAVDGVRAYPDMIRIRVCEQKGRVIGMDATHYLFNFDEGRDLKAGISEDEALQSLSGSLKPYEANLALVPVDGEEILVYEFACAYGEDEYIVYVDANSGEEVEVLRVRETAMGKYLR